MSDDGGVGRRVPVLVTDGLPNKQELDEQSIKQRAENARNNPVPEVKVPFAPWPGVETVLGGKANNFNAWIVMGRDRTGNYSDNRVSEKQQKAHNPEETLSAEAGPQEMLAATFKALQALDAVLGDGPTPNIDHDGPPSGWGPATANYCGAIDLVVGRLSNDASGRLLSRDVASGDKAVHPSFGTDAARVYISQRSNVDFAFHLADGMVGSPEGRSAVAIKADGVRIIGREGIKLVTSTDAYNSLAYFGDKQAGRIRSVKGIDLIAGNNDTNMQPLVKGKALIKCLRSIIEEILSIQGQVVRMNGALQMLSDNYGSHRHIAQGPIGVTTEWPVAPFVCQYISTTCALVSTELQKIGTNLISGVEQTHLGQPGLEGSAGWDDPLENEEYICSRYNHTN